MSDSFCYTCLNSVTRPGSISCVILRCVKVMTQNMSLYMNWRYFDFVSARLVSCPSSFWWYFSGWCGCQPLSVFYWSAIAVLQPWVYILLRSKPLNVQDGRSVVSPLVRCDSICANVDPCSSVKPSRESIVVSFVCSGLHLSTLEAMFWICGHFFL